MNFEKEFLDSLLDREQALRYPRRDRRINRPGHSRVVAIENNSLRSHRKNQPDRWLTRGRALQSDKYPDQSHNHDPQGADQENNQDCGNEIESQDQLNQPAAKLWDVDRSEVPASADIEFVAWDQGAILTDGS